MQIPLICICGPTAVGKNTLAYRIVDLFSRYDFEIINVDSIQIYRYLDIGSAKPSLETRQCYIHHLIDCRTPDQPYSVAQFVNDASAAIDTIYRQQKIPILCGGSVYFLMRLLYGMPQTPAPQGEIRKRLQQKLEQCGSKQMHSELAAVDAESALKISENDSFRIIRNLEIYYTSKQKPSSFVLPRTIQKQFHPLIIRLYCGKHDLHKRITARVHAMFKRDLVGEVKSLVDRGYHAHSPGMRAIGYRQFFDPNGQLSVVSDRQNIARIERAVITATKRYAKHQLTFLDKIKPVQQFLPHQIDNINIAVADFVNTHAARS